MTLQPGTRLGHYEITSLLGSGGMGEVYKAIDEHLSRDVAIKVLPTGTLADEHARQRFRKEALALSKLNHPNIATVHDFDTQEGVDFIVMELVEGASLAEKVKTGPLPEREISDLGSQIADALEEAHERRIVHRDLKPGNIAVTPKGRVKVLDFGLARMLRPVSDEATTDALTQEHAVAGTLPYMSPEELLGERADHRSDLYSLGVVLYEIATGHRPFGHTVSTALADAIIHKPPEPPSTHNRKVSPGLENIIIKALDKDPDHRYQSAREMRVDLERLSAPVSVVVPKRKPVRAGRWLWVAASSAAVIAILLALSIAGFWERLSGGPSPPSIDSIAVLPIENLSGDPEQEYFADGMTEALIADLAKIKALRVISRQSVMRFKSTDTPLPDIARALNVDAIVEGSVLRSRDRVRITTQLVQANPEQHLWADSYERDLRDILALQNEVARKIAQAIEATVTPEEEKRLASSRPVDPDAHEAYLKGRYLVRQIAPLVRIKSLDYFQAALEKDPSYALAYAGLADAYVRFAHGLLPASEAFPKAKAAAVKALELDDTLAVAHAALADSKNHYDYDWVGAEEGFQRVLELDPGYATAHDWYSGLLAAEGRFEEAIKENDLAQRLDPLSPAITLHTPRWLYYARRYDEAIDKSQQALELFPNSERGHLWLGLSYQQKSMHDQAISVLEKAVALPSSGPYSRAGLTQVYAADGRVSDARMLLEGLEELSTKENVPPHLIALAQAALAEIDQAFVWLDKAYESRDAALIWVNVDPGFDNLRSDPRFQDLLRRMNFPE